MNETDVPCDGPIFLEKREHLDDGQRLHVATILLALGKIGPRAINFAPGLLALGVFSDWRIAVSAAFAFVGIGFLFDVLGWMRFRYHVGADDITIGKGVIDRSHSIIPFARIQDVSIEQGPVARMFGLAKVKLETGGQGAVIKNDGVLDVIGMVEAEMLRDSVRTYRTKNIISGTAQTDGVADQGVAAADNAEYPVFAMDLRRILIAGLFNFSLTLFAVLFALLNQLDDVLPFDVFDPDDWIDLLGRNNPMFDYVDAHRWLVAIVGLATIAILGVTTGIIRTGLREYGFTLTRTPNGLRRRRGMLTRTDVLISLRRIQAVLLQKGPLRAAFGWRVVKLQSLGNDETPDNGRSERDHIVAPLANHGESNRILGELGLAEPIADAQWTSAHPIYHRTLVLPAALAIVSIGTGAIFGSGWAWMAVPAIFLLFAALIAGRRHHSWMFDGHILYIRAGYLHRETVIIQAKHIQTADITQGPLYRWFGLGHLLLGIAGGSTISPHSIAAISVHDAWTLRQQLLVNR